VGGPPAQAAQQRRNSFVVRRQSFEPPNRPLVDDTFARSTSAADVLVTLT
jgi:hypothetical protein